MTHHSCDLRKGRFSQAGRIYLVTFATRHRRPLLAAFANARACIAALRYLHEQEAAETLAYVVMPDHVHWLCRLGERCSLSAAVQMLKSLSAKALRRGVPGSEVVVWQRGFHDRALRAEEDLITVARYIVANPVRAGLVPSVRLYPHWDCVWVRG